MISRMMAESSSVWACRPPQPRAPQCKNHHPANDSSDDDGHIAMPLCPRTFDHFQRELQMGAGEDGESPTQCTLAARAASTSCCDVIGMPS